MRALELGAGCGLLGIGLAWMGAEVYLTDLYDQLDVIEANVDRNFGYSSATPQDGIRNDLVRPIRIHIEELDWSSSAEDIKNNYKPPFDLIFGSDIIYSEEALPLLANVLNVLSSPKSVIFIAHEGRSQEIDTKFEQIASQFFHIEVLDWNEYHPVYRSDEICIIKLQKRAEMH